MSTHAPPDQILAFGILHLLVQLVHFIDPLQLFEVGQDLDERGSEPAEPRQYLLQIPVRV